MRQTLRVQPHPALAGRPVYLDYNATTPVDPRVTEAMLPVLTTAFGNPSSGHAFGDVPRAALARARAQVADLVGATPGEIVFLGSGSEADALAVRGAVLARAQTVGSSPHVVTQATEHPAVLAACEWLEAHGTTVTYLPVDRLGRVSAAQVRDAITPSTVLVTVMHANNETGTFQPVAEIAEVCRERGVLLHTDAAQTVGKTEVDVGRLGVDLLTVAGHKMYAPKGIAALYVRAGVRLTPLVGGGGQERGLRAGTENVAFAVGLGAAADLAGAALREGEPARLAGLRDRLHAALASRLGDRLVLNGDPVHRLPGTLNVRVDGVPSRALLAAAPGLAASTGSACHAGQDLPSPVLRAMGQSPEQALSAIRLSLGRWTTPDDVLTAAELLARAADAVAAP